MIRKVMTAAVSAALCSMSFSPAIAQEYRASAFDAPRGASATLNFRVPFGGHRKAENPTYGLRMGYGAITGPQSIEGRTTTREIRVADLRFDRSGLNRAEVASFDLAHLDQDRRLSLAGDDDGKDATYLYIIGGLALVLLGLLVFDGNGSDRSRFDDGGL